MNLNTRKTASSPRHAVEGNTKAVVSLDAMVEEFRAAAAAQAAESASNHLQCLSREWHLDAPRKIAYAGITLPSSTNEQFGIWTTVQRNVIPMRRPRQPYGGNATSARQSLPGCFLHKY